MELELKHVAPYLPYKLKCLVTDNGVEKIAALNALYDDGSCVFTELIEGVKGFKLVQPILRPLSDLTKEIEHSEERFNAFKFSEFVNEEIFKESVEDLTDVDYIVMQKLFEWHFDVFNLIPNRLAVDINTLNQTT